MNKRCGERLVPIHSRPMGWLLISRSLAVAAVCLACVLLFCADSNEGRVGASTPQDSVSNTATDLHSLLRALASTDGNVSVPAKTELQHQHDLLVERLMMIAEAPQKEIEVSPKGRAIALLAIYGARDAAPFFTKNIEYFEPEMILEPDPLAGYPCAKALRTLGAVREIFRFLREPRELSDKAIQLFACVLFFVYEGEGGRLEAIAVVERAIARIPKDQQSNLIRVRDWLRSGSMWPKDPRPK